MFEGENILLAPRSWSSPAGLCGFCFELVFSVAESLVLFHFLFVCSWGAELALLSGDAEITSPALVLATFTRDLSDAF
ncbi:hypothetical protein NL676_037757 [Syzygium grande]|nr:hypothetical protein NL676_037757 [Syzygium grande]